MKYAVKLGYESGDSMYILPNNTIGPWEGDKAAEFLYDDLDRALVALKAEIVRKLYRGCPVPTEYSIRVFPG